MDSFSQGFVGGGTCRVRSARGTVPAGCIWRRIASLWLLFAPSSLHSQKTVSLDAWRHVFQT